MPVNGEPGPALMGKRQIKPGVDRLSVDRLELDAALEAIRAVVAARLNYIASPIRE